MSLVLVAGVPRVLLPCAHDQLDNAEWLVRPGCGMYLGVLLHEQRLRGTLWCPFKDSAMVVVCRCFMGLS